MRVMRVRAYRRERKRYCLIQKWDEVASEWEDLTDLALRIAKQLYNGEPLRILIGGTVEGVLGTPVKFVGGSTYDVGTFAGNISVTAVHGWAPSFREI